MQKAKESFRSGESVDVRAKSSVGEGNGAGGASNMDKARAAHQLAKQSGLVSDEGVAGGAMSGAMSGSAFGPYGAVIGGVLGGVSGGMKAKAAKKKAEAELQNKKLEMIATVEDKKADRISSALGNLQKAFENSLLKQKPFSLF